MAASRITPQQAPVEPAQSSERIAQRYEFKQTLGFGGMARAYRVIDVLSGRELALEQLSFPAEREQRAGVEALFEREFHTLTQLTHPRVIAAYDFGVDTVAGPYYTMELLDGGDLRDRVPLRWRDACTLKPRLGAQLFPHV
jgi:serine/threonine-protein kinase